MNYNENISTEVEIMEYRLEDIAGYELEKENLELKKELELLKTSRAKK